MNPLLDIRNKALMGCRSNIGGCSSASSTNEKDCQVCIQCNKVSTHRFPLCLLPKCRKADCSRPKTNKLGEPKILFRLWESYFSLDRCDFGLKAKMTLGWASNFTSRTTYSHPIRGSYKTLSFIYRGGDLRADSEVCEFHVSCLGQENVCTFDISMHLIASVQIWKTEQSFTTDLRWKN